ncbi:MAG: methyltransferase domain-containing protein [Planctomycetes bacterium]|nr:methyltransferase domain-containing protein [Planctomycetota bacterium]
MFLLPAALALLAVVPQQPLDPEASPNGRTHFLGREIAQTMHWTGAAWLLRATREDEENGVRLRQWLAVAPGQVVCDLGCGNGYHTLPLAEAVGPAGRVLAVELQPQLLQMLQVRARERQLTNVTSIEATVDDPRLPAQSCDLVLLVDVYHELSHPVRVMQRVRQSLRPGGRVVLVEFRAEDPDVPIKPEHKMDRAQVVREMAAHGFRLTASFDGLPWQHAMAFLPDGVDGSRQSARLFVAGFLAVNGAAPRRLQPWLTDAVTEDSVPVLPADARIELAGADRLLATLADRDGQPLQVDRRCLALEQDAEGRWWIAAVGAAAASNRSHGSARPFVAMHTGTGGGSIDDRAALVDELGFDGLAWDLADLPKVRLACERRGGDLYSAWGVLDLPATVESMAPLQAAMQAMAGGPGALWLGIRQRSRSLRDPTGDEAALTALAPLLATAAATGVEIALYPHHDFWLETIDDALRLAERADHRSLGVCFNLCHFLRTGDETDPTSAIRRCGQRLLAVTLNGADRDGADWRSLIQPLGSGDFDLRLLLRALDDVGFAGPVGLQGFGLPAPSRDHLTASMAAWRAAHRR